jgi:hypothetical protein
MKRTIIVMCFGLFVTTVHAQYNERDRVVTINPLRNGDGSFSKANNPLFYNNTSTETMNAKKRQVLTSTTINPFAFRIRSIQAMCDQNSLQLNWTTIQKQNDADHFEIEESVDEGITWNKIGVVPAVRFKNGALPYSFTFNKLTGNSDLRVAAVDINGEKTYSSIVRSACGNNNLFSVDNLVSNTANLRIGSSITQNVKMILTNQSGLPVRAKEAGLTQGINSISLDLSGLQPGIYMLTVLWPGGAQQSAKIVKQ